MGKTHTQTGEGVMGTLYTLHLSPPYKHAGHYEGWTSAPEERFKAHLAGRGSPLIKAAIAAGCEVTVVRTEPGTRHDERRLKNMKNAPMRCPRCKAAARAAKAEKERARRRQREEWLATLALHS